MRRKEPTMKSLRFTLLTALMFPLLFSSCAAVPTKSDLKRCCKCSDIHKKRWREYRMRRKITVLLVMMLTLSLSLVVSASAKARSPFNVPTVMSIWKLTFL